MTRLLTSLVAITLLSSCSSTSTDWREAKSSTGDPVTEQVIMRMKFDGDKYDGLVPLHMGKYFDKHVPSTKQEAGLGDIRVAGYDKQNSYFVICFAPWEERDNNDGHAYNDGKPGDAFASGCWQYCRVPEAVWDKYKSQSNQAQFYEQEIKPYLKPGDLYGCEAENGDSLEHEFSY